ncbi:zinc ribbon domain-containing protein [Gordonia sp. DT219]|uniref:zinc ribbon domain-containing protein n=1 Tax=Gordonia sp. DT219 TaxID=3416658 RepID=UPI003CF9A1C4
MKVEAGRQRLLLELADVDARLARLDHRVRTLPEDAAIAETAAGIESARADLVRAEIAAEDLDREYRRMDGEITGMREREQKDSTLLSAGGLAPKALSELQHEVSGLARRRQSFEDDLLELMERQEALGAERDRASATIAHLDGQLSAQRELREEAVAVLTADQDALTARREEIIGEVPDQLLPIYQRQRDEGKIGAGLLRAQRCGACRMEIDRGTLAAIAAADDDEVIRCEECGAILIRTHESGL